MQGGSIWGIRDANNSMQRLRESSASRSRSHIRVRVTAFAFTEIHLIARKTRQQGSECSIPPPVLQIVGGKHGHSMKGISTRKRERAEEESAEDAALGRRSLSTGTRARIMDRNVVMNRIR